MIDRTTDGRRRGRATLSSSRSTPRRPAASKKVPEIARGHQLTAEERRYVVSVIERWLSESLA
jgi:hypothetical protein